MNLRHPLGPCCVLTALLLQSTIVLRPLGGEEIRRPDDAPPALSPAESAKQVKLPPGFRLQLVASEPLIVEPSGVCWDERGRCFVCELHGYNLEGQYDIEELNKTGQLDRVVRRVMANPAAQKAAAAETYGTVKLLLDTNGDGVFDKAQVWADRLPPCYGVCPARGGVIVACAPDIVFLNDADGDGRAETRQVLFTGFPAGALERGINNPQWGLDNWIYIGQGHPHTAGNHSGGSRITGPALKQPVLLPNTDFRIRADGSAIEPISGGTQTIGMAIDEFGERFVVSTRSPGLFVVPLPWHYLSRNADVAAPRLEEDASPDERVYPISPPHPWRTKRADDPGFSKYYRERYGSAESMPNGNYTSACSPMIYQDRALPGLTGQLLTCEPAQNLVHRAIVERDGPRLRLQRAQGEEASEFLASADPWFHPIALAHAPDGTVWMVDFYREIIEDYSAIPRYLQQQYGLMNGRDRGHVFRLVHDDTPAAPVADMRDLSASALAAEVASPYLWRRQTARRLLVERAETSVVDTLEQTALKEITPAARLNAIYTLEGLGKLSPAVIAAALEDTEPGVRVQALRLADRRFAGEPALLDKALAMASDADPRVLLQLALSLGESSDPRVLPALATLARRHGDIPWMPSAILSSLSGRAGDMLAALLSEQPLGQAGSLLKPLCAAIAARRDADDLSIAITRIAANADTTLQALCLRGIRGNLKSSVAVTLTPAARESLNQLASSSNAEIKTAADELVRLWKLEDPTVRQARLAKAASAAANVQQPGDVRLTAVRELAQENDPETIGQLLAALPTATPQVREAILQAAFSRRERLSAVLDAIERKELAAGALTALQRRTLLDHSDAKLRERAAALLERQQAAIDDQLALYAAALKATRDVAQGEKVFREKCANCHRVHGTGFAVGPDLAAEFQRAEETILKDVLAPSDAITAGYMTYVIETSDGLVTSGLLASESANSVTLKLPGGKTQAFLRKDIESFRALPLSMMPEDLAKTVPPQDLANAIAWIRSSPPQATVISRHVAAPNYCAWPNITRLPNDTLAAIVFNQPSHGMMEGEVECWTSRDGKQWRHAGNPAPHEPNANRMNVAAGLNGQGELVVLASGWSLKPAKAGSQERPYGDVQQTWSSRSTDGGKTWTVNKQGFPVTAEGFSPYIPFGDIVVADDGSLRATGYARHTASNRDDVWMFASKDGGTTWTRLALIAEGRNETALQSLGKGHWLAAARQANTDQALDLYRSDDDGQTWTLQEQLTEQRQHPADLLRLADGRLLLSFGNRQEGSFGVSIKLSADDGKTWGPAIALVNDCLNKDCGYPASVQLADGTIVTGYYASGTAARAGYQFSTILWTPPAQR